MFELARKHTCLNGMINAGWAYDMYPDLPTLDAGKTITLADIEGPGVVTSLHILQHIARKKDSIDFIQDQAITPAEREEETRRCAERGIILEIFYDNSSVPAVCCPLADFFADGCGGKAVYFTSPLVEKLPESHNCFFPMPFKKHILITLRNDTPWDLLTYCCIEHEKLSEWSDDLMYFYATWRQFDFQLTPDTILPVIKIEGSGHLIGQQFSIMTDEPTFDGFFFVMEGNPCYHIDGEREPSIAYLGMEDSFGFSWGFRKPVSGAYNGINHLKLEGMPNELSIYRFRPTSPIIFKQSLDLEVNWAHEFSLGKVNYQTPPRQRVYAANKRGGGWISFAATHYWYAAQPSGYSHDLAPYAYRVDPMMYIKQKPY